MNVSELEKLTDDELSRALSRYRDLLADFDHAHEVEPLGNYRAFLRSQIRRLEGERERRSARTDRGALLESKRT
jgi:hypothetical protein